MPTIKGYGEFELDLYRAIDEQLPPVMDKLAPVALTQNNIDALPLGSQGVYMLYHKKTLVYVGKTTSEHGFKDRLGKHLRRFSHRQGLNLKDIEFKAVRVMVYRIMDLERLLINHYGNKQLSWQNTGIGSNDTGNNRDKQKSSKFDDQYPIDTSIALNIQNGKYRVDKLLSEMKNRVPYTFRYEKKSKPVIDDYKAAIVSVSTSHTIDDLLHLIIQELPTGWYATVLPGRVTLYKQHPDYNGIQYTIP